MTRRSALLTATLAGLARAQGRGPALIIDTDAGTDDLMAIAFLLSRPEVRIEAITVANGLAHVHQGAANLTRLLTLAGKPEIPVFAGRPTPLSGARAFPEDWRRSSDDLPGIRLPGTRRKPQPESAVHFLERRLATASPEPVRILALGPLTNLGELLRNKPAAPLAIERLVMMGGALHVPGNLGDGGAFKTQNTTAEWNMYVDPLAASIVFRSGLKITLIPLDATAKVPIDRAFVTAFQKHARTALGRFVVDVLETDRPHIEGGYFQAWDPLAAVALVDSKAVQTKPMAIEVVQEPPNDGQTKEVSAARVPVDVCIDADAAEFRRTFLSVFNGQK